MFSDQDQDEGIAWPSYVDFLSTFIFVLIIFVGSLLYIMSGDIGDRTFRESVVRTQNALSEAHIENWVEGKKLYISLKDQVKFDTGCPDIAKASCPIGLSSENENHLRIVANIIAANPGWNRIVVEGRADPKPYRDPITGEINEFKNFDLSARRSMQVLQFFHKCSDCGYDVKMLRPRLVLSGLGNKTNTGDDQGERRVDVVLDYSDGLQ
jgi:flagellar motor protein MotB